MALDDRGPQSPRLSRRHVIGTGLKAAGALGVIAVGTHEAAPAAAATQTAANGGLTRAALDSLGKAYQFLDAMMDAYAQGTTLRLAQSYADQSGLQTTAYAYDNALQIIALLESQPAAMLLRRQSQNLARARLLGDSLLYAQQHDPTYTDGRLRDAYFTNPFVLPNGTVSLAGNPFYFTGSSVGNMAWAGLALVHLYAATAQQKYLDGARQLGRWIVLHAYTTQGLGGYIGGVDANDNPLTYKSTEHNIDTYAFFTLLAALTNDEVYIGLSQSWSSLAQHALAFIHAMWDSTAGHFWTGSNPDGATINYYPIPEDVNTWSYLALRDPAYAASIDWATSNLAVTDTPQAFNSSLTGNQHFSGVTFSNASLQANPYVTPNSYTPKPDPSGVWFEGTAHAADALLLRNASGDGDLATVYLWNIQTAQAQLGQNQTVGGKALPNGYGVVSASSPLDTGFGFDYFPNLHIGATSWYLMAAQEINPYQIRRDR
ncbi:MAG TPA: Tat pathway signal sequence domain protein [Chloroflexota bacterium]|nr:Tat pathway signal sequence domain protein [Chloroflexota bacterium]